jgi:hypothetical protein
VTWNPSDKNAAIVLSNGNLTADSGGAIGAGLAVRATTAHSSGKFYFEATYNVVDSDWNSPAVGVMDANAALAGTTTPFDGTGEVSWGLINHSGTYWKSAHDGATGALTGTPTNGDVIGVALDLDAGKIWFSLNGTWFEGDPAAGTGPSYTSVAGTLYPACFVRNTAQVTANFGGSSYAHAAPSGFANW